MCANETESYNYTSVSTQPLTGHVVQAAHDEMEEAPMSPAIQAAGEFLRDARRKELWCKRKDLLLQRDMIIEEENALRRALFVKSTDGKSAFTGANPLPPVPEVPDQSPLEPA